MAVRQRGNGFQIYFRWKNERMTAHCSASKQAEALRIDKAVQTAFKIYRFDHLIPAECEVAMRMFNNKGWKLPPDLETPEPAEELTLLKAIDDYTADPSNCTERKFFSIDRLTEFFGETTSLDKITVSEIKKYRKNRLLKGVCNGTVNIEISTLSGIFREQLEQGSLEFNPCRMVQRLPQTQRDRYVTWDEFQAMLQAAGWLTPIVTIMYYTGMRPSEVFDLDWSEVNFSRRMIILPPSRTKEGKNPNQKFLRDKRVPLRQEIYDLLWSLRHDGDNVVKLSGRVFTHKGRVINRGTKRKCWNRTCKLAGVDGIQLRDLRHAFQSNLALSGVDRTIRNAIVGHAVHLPVEDLYISIPDAKLLEAVETMRFDHETPIGDSVRTDKVYATMTPKSAEKEKGHAGT